MSQAEDRVHRPGQQAQSVNIYQLSAVDTVDEKLKKIIDKKRKIFDRVIEGAEVEKDESNKTIKAVMDDMLIRRGDKMAPMDLRSTEKMSTQPLDL
jgi:SNF2 family DNA or RNA helicase